MSTPALVCRGVGVSYGTTPVLSGVDLRVESGESVALLGPSGSGKTTLLYAVAGLLDLDAGSIEIGGAAAGDGRSLPPEDRRVAMVFQNYALWPHLTAEDTVAYPLRRRGLAAPAARARSRELLDQLGIGDLVDRKPDQLSGGQQQRVGLARALAADPIIFLFDEPTAHLDTALRSSLQTELAQRRRSAGAAALHATHDATEALGTADRVAVLRDGRIVQVGPPNEVYEKPADAWTAALTGPVSILEVPPVTAAAHRAEFEVGDHRVDLDADGERGGVVGARPDWMRLGGRLPGVVTAVWFGGPHTDYELDTPVGPVRIRESGPPAAAVGDAPGWDLLRIWVMPEA